MANAKTAIKRLKNALDKKYEVSQPAPVAGAVGDGKLFIDGQLYNGAVAGVTQVVNVGRPAAAQYAAKTGGGIVVQSGGGGATSAGGGGTDVTALSLLTVVGEAALTNDRYLAITTGLTKVDGGAGAALTLGLNTPGTLTVSSINVATDNHTHAITSSSAPGAAASILASDSSGILTLPQFIATTKVRSPLIDTASGNLQLSPAADVYISKNVGIGVATVETLLHVETADTATVNFLQLEGNRNAADTEIGILFKDRTAVSGGQQVARIFADRQGSTGNFDLVFHGGSQANTGLSTEIMRLKGVDGKVGILQNTPAYTLDVTGTARVTTSLTTPIVTTTGAGVDLTLSPVDDIVLTPGSNIVKLSSSKVFQSDNYASQLTGMRITHGGQGDFRYLYTDEMHAKSFIADLEQALAGGQIIAKSVTILYLNFTAPAAGASTTITVRDLPSATGMACFQDGDYIRVRNFSRAGGGLDISDCWGTVTLDTTYGTSGFDSATKSQRYTFTRSTAPNAGAMTASTVVYADAIILDYGTSGTGFYEVNAIDGLNAINSPYAQIVTWSGHPRTQTLRSRLGNLYGIFAQANEFGLFSGNGTADTDQYLRISSTAVRLNNIPLRLHSSGVQTVNIDSAGVDIWVGPSSADKRLTWNGTTLSVKGAVEITAASSFSGSGYLQVGSGTKDSTLDGFNMSSSEFVGQASGVDQVIMGTDGKITAGAGAVWLDAAGVNFNVQAAGATPSYLRFASGATLRGGIGFIYTAGPTPDATDGMVFYNAQSTKFRFTGATSTEFSATVNVTGSVTASVGMSVGGTAVSLDGHTHSGYLATSGGTLTGTLTSRAITPSADNTYDLGASGARWQDLYAVNLHVGTIVGTPSYSHSHAASDITSGTLDFARIPTTWTGALTMDADSAGTSNYVRWTTQTSTGKAWDLIGRAHDFATAAQQNDMLLTYYDGTTTHIVFQADNATRVIDFGQTPTVGGTAVSLTGHTHDDRYYTESEVNSLLTSYVPTSRAVSAGSGLTGGGALSANITLSHAATSSQASVDNSGTTFIQDITLDGFGHVTAIGSTDIGTSLDSRYVNTSGDTMTGTLNVPTISTAAGNLSIAPAGGTTAIAGAVTLTGSISTASWIILANGVASLAAVVASSSVQTPSISSSGNLTLSPTGGTVSVLGALVGNSTAAFTTSISAPTITTASGDLTLTSAGGTVAVTGAATVSSTLSSTSWSITSAGTATLPTITNAGALTLSPTGNITLTPGGNVTLVNTATLGSNDYASRVTGWRVDGAGGADFRSMYVDEMHAKTFIADLEQALAGLQIIAKSVAVVDSDFTVPFAGAAQILTVRDLPSAPNMAAFQANDYVALRSFSRASGALTIGYAWGQVTSYTDGTGVQSWTFTRSGTTTYNTITARGTATSSISSAATSRSVTKPTGVVSGDVMIAVVTYDGAADVVTASGWTEFASAAGTDINAHILYKVAGGSEPASYTFSIVNSRAIGAAISAYYNVNTSTPIDGYSIQANAAGTNMPAPAAWASSTAGRLVFLGGITNNSSATPPAGSTEIVDAGATGIRVYVAEEALTTSGNHTKTATISASHASVAASVILRPTYASMTSEAGAIVPGTTIAAEALALDFGISGNGFHEVNAVDGTYGANAPYSQVVTWATHPATGQTVRTRTGNLYGLFAQANEYGFYAGNGTATSDTYVRLSSYASDFNNVPISIHESGTKRVEFLPTAGMSLRTDSSTTTFNQQINWFRDLNSKSATPAGTLDCYTNSNINNIRLWSYTPGGASDGATVDIFANGATGYNQPQIRLTDTDSTVSKVEVFANTIDLKYGGGATTVNVTGGMVVTPTAGVSALTVATPANQTAGGLTLNAADCGSGYGPLVVINRNNNASTPSAGWIQMVARTGTAVAVWIDNTGTMRLNTGANPTNANDTSGTVVGTQTSYVALKEDIAPWDGTGALDAVLACKLFSYRFKADESRRQYRGIVINDDDRGAWFSENDSENQTPALNKRNLFGYLIAAIQAQQKQIEQLKEQLAKKAG